MAMTIVIVVILASAILYCSSSFGRTSQELPEPPVIHTLIPFFGHIIGMIRYGKNYYQRLRDQSKLPIVTLPLVGLKVYTVFSVPTIQSIQKQTQSFSFEPVQARFSMKVCGASKDAYRILQRDMHQENGVYEAIHSVMHRTLSPGDLLNKMSIVSAQSVRDSVNDIQPGASIKLDEWVRHHVMLATTNAVYGPYNPFQEKEVEKAFWAFEQALTSLFLLPECFSPQAVRNRKVVSDAFHRYFLQGYHKHGSALIQNFYQVECSYGYSQSDRSLFEVGHVMGILENTYSAVFWLILYVFSSSSALQRIRHEVSSIVTTSVATGEADGKRTSQHILDITKVNSYCPFLVSTFKETMRLHSAGISLREVCKDTVLDNTYLLKKGAVIAMPTISIHTDKRIWGADALSFKYDRFVYGKDTEKEKVSPAAFRSFGGGTTLCPGRHFATTQIMIWISMLVMRFDIEPTSGSWTLPTAGKSNVANAIVRPDHDVEVKFVPREYYNNGTWDVRIANSEATLSLTVGDLVDN